MIKWQATGNDTIDRYPLPYEGRLTKLLCISREIFEKLSLITREFYLQQTVIKDTPAQVQRTGPLPRAPVLPLGNAKETIFSEYAPTKIWPTRHSELWQWQRVSDWWREFGHDEEISNEKRHILV